MPGRPPPAQPDQQDTPPPSDKPAGPVPTPRRRVPPPKPAPYKQHREHRANEITTFKSNFPVQPQMRPHPPVATERKQHRVSLKGEPSDQFFQPKIRQQGPVQYHTPVIPKHVLDKRPRLNTPLLVTPDPDVLLKSPTESQGATTITTATTTTNQTTPTADLTTPITNPTIPSPESSLIVTRPRLNTPLVLPTLESTAAGRNGVRGEDKLLPQNGGEAYATVEEEGEGEGGEEEEEEGNAYAVVDEKKRASLSRISPLIKTTPSLIPSVTPPLPTQDYGSDVSASPSPVPPPLPERNYESGGSSGETTPTRLPGAPVVPPQLPKRDYDTENLSLPTTPIRAPATPTCASSATPIRTSSVTPTTVSHTKPTPRPPNIPLPQTPPSMDEGYSVTSHLKSLHAVKPVHSPLVNDVSTSNPPLEGDLYSHIAPHLGGLEGEYSHLEITGNRNDSSKSEAHEPEYEIISEILTLSDPQPPRRNRVPPKKPPRPNIGPEPVWVSPAQFPVPRVATADGGSAEVVAMAAGGQGDSDSKPKPVVKPKSALIPIGSKSGAMSPKPLPPIPPKSHVASPTTTKMSTPPPTPLKPSSSSPLLSSVKPSSSPPPAKAASSPLASAKPTAPPKPPSATPPSRSSPAPPTKPKPRIKPPPLSIQSKLMENDSFTFNSEDSPVMVSPVMVSPEVELDIDSFICLRESRIRNGTATSSSDVGPQAIVDSMREGLTVTEGVANGGVAGNEGKSKDQYMNQEVVPDMRIRGAYTAPLSPTEVFTVPQHAVPGPLNYCELDIKGVAPQQPQTLLIGDGEDVESAVTISHTHPDARGYCDINVTTMEDKATPSKEPPSNDAPNEELPRNDAPSKETPNIASAGGSSEEDEAGYTLVNTSNPTRVKAAASAVIATPTNQGFDSTDAGPSDPPARVTLKTPKPSAKPTRPSEVHSRTPSCDTLGSEGSQETPREASSMDANTPTTPTSNEVLSAANQKAGPVRRRAPPPPPAAVRNQLEDILNSGLCTLPRSPRKSERTNPPPPPPSFTRRKSEELLKPQNLPPLPMEPPPLSPDHTPLPVAQNGQSVETTNSPGLRQKFMGFLKKPGMEFRQSSRRKKKQQQQQREELTQSMVVPSSTMSLSRNIHAKQFSYDREDSSEGLSDFGVYSVITEKDTAKILESVSSGKTDKREGGDDEEGDKDDGVPVMDEAGYEVIKTKKKQKPKKPPKGASAMGERSSSADHLYDSMDFADRLDGRGSKSTNNSPQIPRRSPDRRAERGVAAAEEAPPIPNEGVDVQDHLYAQVVKNKKKRKKVAAGGELPAGEKVSMVVSNATNDKEEGGSSRESGQDLGASAEGKGEEPEVIGIPSGDIEHESSGSHLYAVINTKKSKKAASLANPNPDKETTPINNESTPTGVEEVSDVNSLDFCTPTSVPVPVRPPPRGGKVALPPKPAPFSGRAGITPPTSPGVDSGVSISSQGSGGPGPERARSPVRQAPPIPKSTKVSVNLPSFQRSLSPPCEARPRISSISSRPPDFPPPPPPPTPTTPPPTDGTEDPAYAVVDQCLNKRKNRRKHSDSALSAPPTDKLVLVESVARPSNAMPRLPHTYTSVVKNGEGNGLISRTETIPVKTHPYATANGRRGGSRKHKGEKMKTHPSLPPKHTPPPPPPPSSSQTLGSEGRTNPGGPPQFLFRSDYSSTLIKVGSTESSRTNAEEDSDADPCYSTDWETSSNGEDEEDEDLEMESQGPRTPRSKTFYIAQEILTTERTFVKGLTLLDKDFRQAVRSANNAHEKPVISEENIKVILGNVGSILVLNSGLLEELETRMMSWDNRPMLGDIFVGRAPFFKIYTEYISRFDNALKTLDEQKKTPLFASVLYDFESQAKCANIPVAGYMLDVVQRITRYKLLVADYVRHLPEDSMDRLPSEKALDIISQVATHVNETIRQMDNFRKVVEVRKKLIGDSGETLITPSRKLLKEGELMKFSRKEKQSRMFFLFNDILIYASAIPPTNNTYKVIKRIPVEGMMVDLLDDPEMKHAFQIISTCKSFRLEASNEKERMQWFKGFEKAIKEQGDKTARQSKVFSENTDAAPLGSLAPAWLPDSSVSMCQLCSFNFTMTRRRHHCRACGMVFCGDCSGYFAPLKYKNNKIGRVCQTCCEKLTASDSNDNSPTKRVKTLPRQHRSVSMPSVLREVRARDQSAQISGYLHSSASKTWRWKRRWFVVYDLVLYEFERHEDVSAKRSVTLPSYQVISPIPRHDDPLVFCLKHSGMGKEYFKAETEEQLDRWVDVLKKAVIGEKDDSSSTPQSSATHTPTHPSAAPFTPPLNSHDSQTTPSLPPHTEEEMEEPSGDSFIGSNINTGTRVISDI